MEETAGEIWKPSGGHLGIIWEQSGCIWESSGGHLNTIWGAFGRSWHEEASARSDLIILIPLNWMQKLPVNTYYSYDVFVRVTWILTAYLQNLMLHGLVTAQGNWPRALLPGPLEPHSLNLVWVIWLLGQKELKTGSWTHLGKHSDLIDQWMHHIGCTHAEPNTKWCILIPYGPIRLINPDRESRSWVGWPTHDLLCIHPHPKHPDHGRSLWVGGPTHNLFSRYERLTQIGWVGHE